jgi:predicted DNA-binding protein with PD1-like motif
MKSKLLSESPGERSVALIFETGDQVMSTLTRFAEEHHLRGSHFTAIGAFSDLTLAYFDWQSREYQKISMPGQVEVLSLIGDIAESDGKPKVHAHVVVGKRDGTAHGGHLIEARVRPTLEVILSEAPTHLRRKMDPQSGLPLISA